MGKRKSSSVPRPKPFDQALAKIDAMERCCCYRTVTCEFTVRDLIEYLWPPDVVAALRAAHPYAQMPHSIWDHSDSEFTMRVDVRDEGIICPRDQYRDIQHGAFKAMEIRQALQAVKDNCFAWRKVRECVEWLNTNATPAAARFYFPSLGALLPYEHPFNLTDGSNHKEPRRPISEVAPLMREAMATIAVGLLSYSEAPVAPKNKFRVRVQFEDGSWSNEFHLL